MVLVMESIEAPMRLRPRYWKRLFTVLIVICKEDISPFVFQVNQWFSVATVCINATLSNRDVFPLSLEFGNH